MRYRGKKDRHRNPTAALPLATGDLAFVGESRDVAGQGRYDLKQQHLYPPNSRQSP